MPLSLPVSRRALKHTRTLRVDAFSRDDGLWDLDAQISDVKTLTAGLASGERAAGAPIHDLLLRITIDLSFNIVAAEAVSDAVPYPGFCDTIGGAYQQLVGLNLFQGFRAAVKARVGGAAGCTHLTELTQFLPTAALQAFAGEVIDTRDGAHDDQQEKPFQLDRCHALRSDGAAVAQYYPRWSIRPRAPLPSS